jgi:hypothetical protein
MWGARRARGVLMVMEEHRMKLQSTNSGQGALSGIKVCLSSGAALPC